MIFFTHINNLIIEDEKLCVKQKKFKYFFNSIYRERQFSELFET